MTNPKGRFILLALVVGIVISLIASVSASALSGASFKAGRIIDDSVFNNSNTMTVSQIQNFLNAKVPVCDTNGQKMYSSTQTRAQYGASRGYPAPYTCLKTYKQTVPTVTNSGSDLCKGSITGGTKTAAQIIYDVSKACGVNPQTLIVLLQKEQSLITDDWPWSIQYRSATGYGCPDTAPCDSEFYGYFNQVYQAAKAFKRYEANPANYNYRAGRTNYVYYNPDLSRCGGSNVYIENQATANLYIYTPYQPNTAALNNLYGSGDSCSSYGNRNFWRMFNDWFGTTTQSILFKVNGDSTYYLEWGDMYYPIPSGDVLHAYGLHGKAPRTVSSFPAGKTKGPVLQRAAKFGSENPADANYTESVTVVDGGEFHNAPNWPTLNNHGFTSYSIYDASMAYLLKKGENLAPVVRKSNGAIYALENNKKRLIPDGETYKTLSGPNASGSVQVYSAQAKTNMSDSYINAKVDGAPLLLDGKFIKASSGSAIYIYDNNKKYPFTPETYQSWGRKLDYTFSSAAITSIITGNAASEFVKTGTSNFLIHNSAKSLFSASTQSSWGLIDSDFMTMSERTLSRLNNGGAAPTLVKGTGPAVYHISGGKKHIIPTMGDFTRLGFSWDNVKNISNGSLSGISNGQTLFAPGTLVRLPDGTVYLIDANFIAHGISSEEMFKRFGFDWKLVRNLSSNGMAGYSITPLYSKVMDDSTNKHYLVEGGVYHYIDSVAMASDQYNLASAPTTTIDPAVLQRIKPGRQMTRFVKSSSPTVYYIENGQKRPFSSQSSFYSMGGSWDKVTVVASYFLDEITTGPSL